MALAGQIDRSVFNRRRRQLMFKIEHFRQRIASVLASSEDYCFVDSMPLEICKFGGAKRLRICRDNSPTERFFRSLIKHEQLNYEKFRTKASAKLSIIDYLAFYNGKRTHSKLGYQTPLEFERDFYRKAV